MRSVATRAFPSISISLMIAPSDSSAIVFGIDGAATSTSALAEAEAAIAALLLAEVDAAADVDPAADAEAAEPCAPTLGAPSTTARKDPRTTVSSQVRRPRPIAARGGVRADGRFKGKGIGR